MLHLVRRFFGFLVAAPLTPSEQRIVSDALAAPVARLFFTQRPEDQRHAFEVARPFRDDPDLFEAALTHDVGKTVGNLGALARSAATIGAALRLPLPERWRTYLDHGPLGADALAEAGAGALAVAFARHHPGSPPDGVDPDAWHQLEESDAG